MNDFHSSLGGGAEAMMNTLFVKSIMSSLNMLHVLHSSGLGGGAEEMKTMFVQCVMTSLNLLHVCILVTNVLGVFALASKCLTYLFYSVRRSNYFCGVPLQEEEGAEQWTQCLCSVS
ncbi:hypothetical protein CEXT_749561 [Caerostris extrusa]|uniref:Uncharacterized protein n=1 Tax=Caerostris extrusa TaxID=172846 RepID=A0AAV4NL49_CAEEX|nr:hypothetical protein CEXT_749561 [Caerostris extrusa]